MYSHCLFCGRRVLESGAGRRLRVDGRLAFDTERGRVWTVCGHCHGWNLWPADERPRALEVLEHLADRRARLLCRTENVALLETAELEMIRVGRGARLPEEAWWRYGRELRRRRARFGSPMSRVGVVTYGAVSYLGSNLGFSSITGEIDWEEEPFADILRWRRFGRTAWSGRAACPYCHSVLLKLRYYAAASLYLLKGRSGGLAIGLPCSRCDEWSIERVHRLEGEVAERVLRRVLAYRNISGAAESELGEAMEAIELAGSPAALAEGLVAGEVSLADLDARQSLALEVCVNENAERRQLAAELAGVEARWREAEKLAGIIDRELGPGPGGRL